MERLKRVLDSVISNFQTTYIKGHSILDGQLMVNEIINWAKGARKKILIFKVDFAKAFDSLNWNFLDNVFLHMGFGDKRRACEIIGCICTKLKYQFSSTSYHLRNSEWVRVLGKVTR